MSRNPQEIARVVQSVLRLAGPRRSPGAIVAVLVIGLLIAVLAPTVQGWLPPSEPTAGQGGSPPAAGRPAAGEAAASDYLEQVGAETYRSPAGLVYGRGSQHGHRLKHLMAHAEDQPDRPGSHGVFDAKQPVELLTLIDQGYRLAKSGRQTRTRKEEGRTIYVIDMRRRIGYVGGESGARRGKPAATNMQLITDGDRFITAYPLTP
ncbi:hypothetical protein Pla175_35150 [Pirellulimonas nuda]|uniref:Uncharacterized protein n=1 Tax=Pirellulimonas nuda TaxID=2528009 RepID=A0A518DF57_9BACT|nr:hypothetical protein [Pirellulimonas nuda]QDU90115.1 hypothetical protein Pla175_35150 [Pirellulimonas nuda]